MKYRKYGLYLDKTLEIISRYSIINNIWLKLWVFTPIEKNMIKYKDERTLI